MITYREPVSALEIYELATQSFGESPWTEKAFTTDLANKWTHYRVCVDTHTPIGFVSGTLIGDELSISHVAISQEKQGQGFGFGMLVHWLESFPTGTRALLEVRSSNAAGRRLYEKVGFSTYYVRKDYYHNPIEDAVMMEYTITGREAHDN